MGEFGRCPNARVGDCCSGATVATRGGCSPSGAGGGRRPRFSGSAGAGWTSGGRLVGIIGGLTGPDGFPCMPATAALALGCPGRGGRVPGRQALYPAGGAALGTGLSRTSRTLLGTSLLLHETIIATALLR